MQHPKSIKGIGKQSSAGPWARAVGRFGTGTQEREEERREALATKGYRDRGQRAETEGA